MRDLPQRDPRDPQGAGAEDAAARATFESYAPSVQSMKIQTGIGAIGGALTGLKGGPVGAFVGAAFGALAGYWRGKAYREQVYAQLDAMGLLKRRPFQRDTLSRWRQKFTFARYPYGEQTALVILPLLQKYYPGMTDAELNTAGTNVQKSLLQYRRDHKDIPIALAAEAVLAYYGVVRNEYGEYDLLPEARAGQIYEPPPLWPALSPPPISPPSPPPPPISPPGEKKPSKLIYYVIAAIILLMLSED